MAAHELSALLWRERELLELLQFKLEEEQLLLTAGKTRWLQHATREVEQVMTRLRTASLARTVEVSEVARKWGRIGTDEPTLRELIPLAPEGPWGEILSAHLAAMTSLTGVIKSLRDANEQFLRAASRATQETLAGIVPESGTYDAAGVAAAPRGAGFHLVDTTL